MRCETLQDYRCREACPHRVQVIKVSSVCCNSPLPVRYADIAFWHFSDLAQRPAFVRNVGKSGNDTGRTNRFSAIGFVVHLQIFPPMIHILVHRLVPCFPVWFLCLADATEQSAQPKQ